MVADVPQLAKDLATSEDKTKKLLASQRLDLFNKADQADQEIVEIRQLLRDGKISRARVAAIDLILTRRTFRAMEANYKMIGELVATISRAKMAIAAVEAGSSVMHALKGVETEKITQILETFERASERYRELADNVAELEGEKDMMSSDPSDVAGDTEDDITELLREIASDKATHTILLSQDTLEDLPGAQPSARAVAPAAATTIGMLDAATPGIEGSQLPPSTGHHYADADRDTSSTDDDETAHAHALRIQEQYQSDQEVQGRVVANTLEALSVPGDDLEHTDGEETDMDDRYQAHGLLPA